jgi:hypothetical protein
MAEGKKSFVLYSDQRSIIDMLSDEKAGKLLKHMFAYVNDENPISDDPLILLAFEPIKLQMKRDLIKWKSTKEVRSEAGKASAEARRLAKEQQQNVTNSTNVNFVQQSSTNSTVNVNDNVTVNVNVINTIPTKEEFVAYGLEKLPEVSVESLRLKYESWTSSDWCTNKAGKLTKIKNWKSTLLNTLPYLPKEQKQESGDHYSNHVINQIKQLKAL